MVTTREMKIRTIEFSGISLMFTWERKEERKKYNNTNLRNPCTKFRLIKNRLNRLKSSLFASYLLYILTHTFRYKL